MIVDNLVADDMLALDVIERFQEHPWRVKDWRSAIKRNTRHEMHGGIAHKFVKNWRIARKWNEFAIKAVQHDTICGAACFHTFNRQVSLIRLIVHPEWFYDTAGKALLNHIRDHAGGENRRIVCLVDADDIMRQIWLGTEGFQQNALSDNVMEFTLKLKAKFN